MMISFIFFFFFFFSLLIPITVAHFSTPFGGPTFGDIFPHFGGVCIFPASLLLPCIPTQKYKIRPEAASVDPRTWSVDELSYQMERAGLGDVCVSAFKKAGIDGRVALSLTAADEAEIRDGMLPASRSFCWPLCAGPHDILDIVFSGRGVGF
jgi:hypothetical protein